MTAAVALLATACQKPEPITPAVTLTSPADVTVNTEGGQFTVTFESNVPWTASLDNANWTASPKSGEAGTATIKVTAAENTSNDPVVTKLTVKAQSASATVTFTQLQKDGMVVNVSEYEAPAEASTVSVKVLANVTVTATTSTPWLQIAEGTKGLVEKTFEVAVEANGAEAREGQITVKGAGKEETITIKQAAFEPKFEISQSEFDVEREGGEFTFTVTSNVEWAIKDYSDGTQPFLKAVATKDGNNATVKVTLEANEEYASRSPYVKFTVPAIQDPVIDEETGEPTGETKDHVEKVYFHQAGYMSISWKSTLPEQFTNGVQLSMAKVADKYLIYDGVTPMFFNPASGAFSSIDELEELFIATKAGEDADIAEIFNDDAGNFLAVTKTSYLEPFDVFVIPAGASPDEAVEPIHLISSNFDYYGYGFGHFAARGNVLENGIVTAIFTGQVDGGIPVAGAYWEIKNGEACERERIDIPTDGIIWSANNVAFTPLGTSAADGFLYDGYDGNYALRLLAGGTSTTLATIGDWANGVTCIGTGLWGSKTVVAINNMAFFPQWGMPSYLMIFDAATMEAIANIDILEEGLEAAYMANPSTCVLLEQKGDALIIYSADGAQGVLQKIVLPAK